MPKKEDTEEPIVEIDVAEWKTHLSLPEDTEEALHELGTRFEKLNGAFGELLLYMNAMDERVQRLAGEPVVTTLSQTHIGTDGVAGLNLMRPEIPESIANPHAAKAKRGKKSQTPEMKRANQEEKILPPVVSK